MLFSAVSLTLVKEKRFIKIIFKIIIIFGILAGYVCGSLQA